MPMGDEYPDYPHHERIRAYINDYADAFSLRDRIRFETPSTADRHEAGGETSRSVTARPSSLTS